MQIEKERKRILGAALILVVVPNGKMRTVSKHAYS